MRQPDAARGPCHDRCALRHSTPPSLPKRNIQSRGAGYPASGCGSVRHVLALLLAASAAHLAACGGNEEPSAPPPRARRRPAGRLPLGAGQDAPGARRRADRGTGPRAQHVDPARGRQPVRVRAVRQRTEDGRGLGGRDLHVQEGRIGPAGPYRRGGSASPSSRRIAARRPPGTSRTAKRSTWRACRSAGGQRCADRARADGWPSRRDRRVPAAGPREAPGPPKGGRRRSGAHAHARRTSAATSKLTTRVPADRDPLDTDLADVLGKKPVVLLFATPAAVRRSRVRAGHRHRRAGPARSPGRRGLHPPGDLPGQHGLQGHAAAGRTSTSCRPSPGLFVDRQVGQGGGRASRARSRR